MNHIVSGFLYFLGSLIAAGCFLGIFVYSRNQIRWIAKRTEPHRPHLMAELKLGKWGSAVGFVITAAAIVLELCSLPVISARIGSACLTVFILLQIAAHLLFRWKER